MAKPGAHGKDKQRCGARVRTRRNWHGGPGYCLRWPVDGLFGRCHLHGGKSTGPKTPEGKARVVAAMVAGRRAWLEKLKAEGQKVPCGPNAKKFTTKLKVQIEAAKRGNKPEKADREFYYTPDPLPQKQHMPDVNLIPDPRVAKAMAVLQELQKKGF